MVYVNQVIEANADGHSQVTGSSIASVKSLASNLDWTKVDPHKAFTYELCTGLCDKSKSLEETVREEIFKKCGYSIKEDHQLRKVKSFRNSFETMFYCEISSCIKVNHSECVSECNELFELPIDKVKDFVDDESLQKPPTVLFALTWFLYLK